MLSAYTADTHSDQLPIYSSHQPFCAFCDRVPFGRMAKIQVRQRDSTNRLFPMALSHRLKSGLRFFRCGQFVAPLFKLALKLSA
jgi:hypothetical protein